MKNAKLVAWGMTISIGIAVLNGISVEADSIYTLAGIGMLAFGVWASVLLFNHKEI